MATQVEIETGVLDGRLDVDVRTWRAIPYAAPPVGALRLRAPQPAASWTGVREATEYRHAAVSHPFSAQLGFSKKLEQSEDCLTLDVTAPAEPSVTLRPVMFFIHGGGYYEGTTALPIYDPRPLVRRGDVVLVNLNYRLNGLGYVDFSAYSTPERPFDSNLGLRDQVAALQWVQRNIAAFGGDPHNVTIFGESAGGSAVTTLMCTPAAHGLFHHAIAQSAPSDLNLDPERAASIARRCIRHLGANAGNAAEVLTTATARRITNASFLAGFASIRKVPGRLPFGPVIDGAYLPEDPLRAFAAGRALPVPLIIGTNASELSMHGMLSILPTNVRAINRMFGATNPAAQQQVLDAYPGYPARRVAAQFGTDSVFRRPTLAVAESHSVFAPTYLYRLDYGTPLLRRTGIGPFHSFDLGLVFGTTTGLIGGLLGIGGRNEMLEVSRRVQDQWLTFARTGAPKSTWPTYTDEHRSTLVIDVRPRIVDDLDRGIRRAWSTYAGPFRDLAQGLRANVPETTESPTPEPP